MEGNEEIKRKSERMNVNNKQKQAGKEDKKERWRDETRGGNYEKTR
jgi:hypothetical protein